MTVLVNTPMMSLCAPVSIHSRQADDHVFLAGVTGQDQFEDCQESHEQRHARFPGQRLQGLRGFRRTIEHLAAGGVCARAGDLVIDRQLE